VGRRWSWLAGSVLAAGCSLLAYIAAVRLRAPHMSAMFDLGVYRAAAAAAAHGHRLYDVRFPPIHLPFTYTPFAALLFLPLTWLSWDRLRLVVGLVNVAALFGSVALSVRLAGGRTEWRSRLATTLLLGAACLWTEPVQQTLGFGQVNLVLLLLVLTDLNLPDGSRAKGVLIGMAAAIKLTPAVLIAYLFVTGRRAAALRAAAAVATTAVLGAVFLPQASWAYWTHDVFGARRIGNPVYVANQSVKGVLVRLLGPGLVTDLVWAVLAAGILVVGLTWAARLHRRGHDLAGAVVAAGAGLLASPISWSHHWVWIVPALVLAWESARRSHAITVRAVPLVVLATFAAWWIAGPGVPGRSPLGLLWLVPARHGVERHWDLGQSLLGNLYVEVAVLAAVVAGALALSRRRSSEQITHAALGLERHRRDGHPAP
jgi:alpha-1,2-mannosyltransferase